MGDSYKPALAHALPWISAAPCSLLLGDVDVSSVIEPRLGAGGF
jgi:hypothetical protein